MSERYDVIVVGGGAMGTATARNLAMRGRHTLLLERFTFGHANGSSGGPTRIFRFMYHTPGYARMAIAAKGRVGRAAGRGRRTRSCTSPAASTSATPRSRGPRCWRPSGRRSNDCSPEQATNAGRTCTFPTAPTSCSSPTAACCGRRAPSRCRPGSPPSAGAEVREETHRALDRRDRRARRRDHRDGRHFTAPTRGRDGRGVGRARAAHGGVSTCPCSPAWSRPRTSGSTEAARRPRPPAPAHDHRLAPPTRSSRRTWSPTRSRTRPVTSRSGCTGRAAHRRRDPNVRPRSGPGGARPGVGATAIWTAPSPLDRTDTCLYTITPDEDFILDRVGPLVVASPCSGHGFKFVPLFGQVIADLATGVDARVPTGRLPAWIARRFDIRLGR